MARMNIAMVILPVILFLIAWMNSRRYCFFVCKDNRPADCQIKHVEVYFYAEITITGHPSVMRCQFGDFGRVTITSST